MMNQYIMYGPDGEMSYDYYSANTHIIEIRIERSLSSIKGNHSAL